MTMMVQHLMAEVARIRDCFHDAVFGAADLEAALALTATDCVLVHLPTGAGASGAAALRGFLAHDLTPHLPADLAFRQVSRTVDRWRVAEEAAVTFTHDRALPWLLPGVAATHRPVEVLAVSVVTVRRGLIVSHRTHWDLYGLKAQLQG